MAISLGYGIVFATLITLVLVPCLFLVLEDFRSLWPASASAADVHTETTKLDDVQ